MQNKALGGDLYNVTKFLFEGRCTRSRDLTLKLNLRERILFLLHLIT